MNDVLIRDARIEDAPRLLTIYNEIVASSTAIFTETPRTLPEMTDWFKDRRAQGRPILAATLDGEVIGYCSYGPFRTWPGYRHTVENSVYLAPEFRGRGVGRRLLEALLERAREQGVHTIIAGIDGDNVASMRLHERCGFTKAAHLHQVARKFDRWLDLVFYERVLESGSSG